jgi:glycogen synthase kinase 3 beta
MRPGGRHLPPTRFADSKYQIITKIGEGAFGSVYSARCMNGETVAIKTVVHDPRYKNRELEIVKLLRHPNCVSHRASFRTVGRRRSVLVHIVMDFLPSSLQSFCASHRARHCFPALLLVRLFAFELFAGLAYLHGLGVAHRDVKPDNVLVDIETGALRICDFGSAKVLRPGDASVPYIASRYYRAPELLLGCTHYTTAVDVWAAGCVVAELLTAGMPLFMGATSDAQIGEVAKVLGPPPLQFGQVSATQVMPLEVVLPGHTPKDLFTLLRDILVYAPEKRPTATQVLAYRCFDELFRENVRLPNGRLIPPLSRPARGAV